MIPENTSWCSIHNINIDDFGCSSCNRDGHITINYCSKHAYDFYDYSGCPWCRNEKVNQTIGYQVGVQEETGCVVLRKQSWQRWPKKENDENDKKIMKQRKYLPTLAELLDRLVISQTKELKIPEHREEYTQEINDIVHDIQLIIDDSSDKTGGKFIDANMLRDVIILSLINREIWINEENARKGNKEGNKLELSHGLNGIRNAAKNKIQEKFGGRKDYKIDNVQIAKQWIPSGYYSKPEDEDEYLLCENCGLEVHPNLPCEEVGGIDKRKK